MASITFGGLASGIDSEAIINALMDVERKPIDRLENDKAYLNTRLQAYSDFDGKLKNLLSSFEDLDTSKEFRSYSATAASEEYFTVDAESTADPGSYNIEVVNLAQVQKDVSVGYASASDGVFSAGTIDINGTTIDIADGDALGTIVDKINAANTGDAATGVSAALIDDGTDAGYRIVLTGENASTDFTVSVDGVSDGTTDLSFSNTQTAQQATVNIDGITIVSDNNTLTDAIPGVTIDLLKPNTPGETTRLAVDVDKEGIKSKVDAFVSAYNDIITFISDQKDTSWGAENGLQGTKRRLQTLLTTPTGGDGAFQTLVDIGIKTNKDDGTISLDSTRFNDALTRDLDSVEKLFIGDDTSEGIATKFTNYLDGITDSVDGLYATRKSSTERSVKNIDNNIESIERRLEMRERTLRAQYESLELLMSSMNSTSSYLDQQFSSLNATSK